MNSSLLPILEVSHISHVFETKAGPLPVLHDLSFSLHSGEFVTIMGESGAGKSTLLHLCGLLEKPKAGEVLIQGRKTSNLSEEEKTLLRGRSIGFIYQFHNLLPELTALENIMMPMILAGRKRPQERAERLLEAMNLQNRRTHLPAALSGGERQRVAIARALANNPPVLLADEPTGNLDHETGAMVFELIKAFARGENRVVLMVTHNLELAKKSDKIFNLQNGQIFRFIKE